MSESSAEIRQRAFTVAEVAVMLAVSEKTIRRQIHAGSLRALKVGSQWRVRDAEVDAYLRRQEQKR